MKKEKLSRVLAKWEPVLENLGFDEEYTPRLSRFAENIAIIESMDYATTLSGTKNENNGLSLLPINLKILSKVKDLSKIKFMDAPKKEITDDNGSSRTIQADTIRYDFDITSETVELLKLVDKQVVDVLESKIVNKISSEINNITDSDKEVYVYNLCQNIMMIREENKEPKVFINSRYAIVQ